MLSCLHSFKKLKIILNQVFHLYYSIKLEKNESGGICLDLFHLYEAMDSGMAQIVEEYQDLFYLYCKGLSNLCCKIPTFLDCGGILGSILFVLQNSRHFWTMEEYFGIYFIFTVKFLTFSDGGGIFWDLLYLYCKISDIFRWWRNILGSTLFILQNF